jgi:hypothetical protein
MVSSTLHRKSDDGLAGTKDPTRYHIVAHLARAVRPPCRPRSPRDRQLRSGHLRSSRGNALLPRSSPPQGMASLTRVPGCRSRSARRGRGGAGGNSRGARRSGRPACRSRSSTIEVRRVGPQPIRARPSRLLPSPRPSNCCSTNKAKMERLARSAMQKARTSSPLSATHPLESARNDAAMLASVMPRSASCSLVSRFSATEVRTRVMPGRSAAVASRTMMSLGVPIVATRSCRCRCGRNPGV